MSSIILAHFCPIMADTFFLCFVEGSFYLLRKNAIFIYYKN